MEPQFPDNNHFNAIPAPQPVAPHQHAQTNIPVSAFYTPNNPPAPVGPPQTHTHTQALNATQLPPQHHPHVQAQAQVQARQSFGTEQGQGQGQMARSVEMGVATGMGMGMGMGAEGQRQRQTHGQLSGSMGSGGRHSGQSGMGGVSGVTGDGGGGDGGVDFFSDGSHNAFAKMGLSLGKNLVSKKVGGVFAFIQAQRLKTYFAVNNDYVLRKLKILLMPLSHKNYLRKKRNSHSMHGMSSQMQGDSADEGAVVYLPPIEDVNAPDLYVPLMAFITYILLMGYCYGQSGSFTPEVIAEQATSTLMLLILEIMLVKLGFAVIGSEAPSPRLLELAAYCGYKYVLCIICMLVGLLLGSLCFYVSVLACGSCMGLFMMRTINPYLSLALNNSNGSLDSGVGYPSVSHSFPSSASSANNAGSKKFATTKRNYLLLALGVFQLIMLYLLVRSTLSHTSGGGLLGLLWGSGGGGDDDNEIIAGSGSGSDADFSGGADVDVNEGN